MGHEPKTKPCQWKTLANSCFKHKYVVEGWWPGADIEMLDVKKLGGSQLAKQVAGAFFNKDEGKQFRLCAIPAGTPDFSTCCI